MSLNLTSAKINKLIDKPLLVDFNKLNKVKQRQLLEVISYALQLKLTPYTWFVECHYNVGDINTVQGEYPSVVHLDDVGDFNTNLGGSNLLVNLVMSNVTKELLSRFVSTIKESKVNNKRGVKLSDATVTVNFLQRDSNDVELCYQISYKADLSDLNFTPFLKYLEVALEQEKAK